ncbi:hypothetical protein [Azohydromonas lata]|jgi:hypothetical protein|uniref:hypothetical protein n=1 Tax=Azohydromonas lata TaxID=45677 RepID=UPI001EE48C55|nr:hypothetical protein [Azohydromonas lata]
MSTDSACPVTVPRRAPATARITALLMAFAMLGSLTPAAAQAQQRRDGVWLYWGVVPAAIVSERHSLEQLHGQAPQDGGQVHHLVVALFEDSTGKRIDDAVVRAQLREPGITDASPKYLLPMQVNGLMSYGQMFSVVKPGPYKFQILVKLPGRPSEIEFLVSASSPHPGKR